MAHLLPKCLCAAVLGLVMFARVPAAVAAQAGRIDGISPPAAAPGDEVTITGIGFGGRNVRIAVGGVAAPVLAATGRRATFVVPAVPAGSTTVTATNPGGHTGRIAFLVTGRDTTPPTLTVNLAPGLVVNQSPLLIRGQASDDQGRVSVAVGTDVVEVQADGSFETRVVLSEGPNLILVAALDGSGNRASRRFDVTLDGTPPALFVAEPREGIVNRTTVHVAGHATDTLTAVAVTVQGQAVDMHDGSFSTDVTLPGGPNRLVVTATDALGNRTSQSVDLTVFVSPAASYVTPGDMRVVLPEGALTRPGQTLEVRDLTHTNVQNSLGPEGAEIVASVPAGGLTDDVIVIPGAVAMTFDGPDLPDQVINGTPAFSVPAAGGLSNDIPLWILQMVPDSNGDGVPELRLASQARISDDGARLEPVIPPPGSPLPGFQFAREFAFDEATISQVDGLTHSSLSFVACCCGAAFVAIEGDTNCNPGPTAKSLIDAAKRIAESKKAAQNRLRQKEGERRNILLNEMLGADGSVTATLELIAGIALAGQFATVAVGEVAAADAAALAEIAADVLGESAASTATGVALAGAKAALEAAGDVIDDVNADLGDYIGAGQDIEDLNALMESDDINISGLLAAAHTFSGCSEPLVDAANAASRTAAGLGVARASTNTLLVAAERARANLLLLRQTAGEVQTRIDALDPFLRRLADGAGSAQDGQELVSRFTQVSAFLTSARDPGATARNDVNRLAGSDPDLAYVERENHANLTAEFVLIDAIPASDGVFKGGVALSVAGAGQHHGGYSTSTGSFLVYDHTQFRSNQNGTYTVAGRSVTVNASLGTLSNSATASYGDLLFPGAGMLDFAVDVGTIPLGMDAAGLVDTDGDGAEDGAEDLGGTSRTDPDTDHDGFNDLAELLAGSVPTDAASVPGDDRDRDGIPDADEAGAGTDPDDADTDGDLLLDGAEIRLHGTQPLRRDTDGDEFTDWAELLLGSDPTDPASRPGTDTDGDGLPDGVEPTYGADRANPDTDGDGIGDGLEVFVHRTSPQRVDTDADAIDDPEELISGVDGFVTDPRDRDTDRDRYRDGTEVTGGSDPTDPTSTPGTGVVSLTIRATFAGSPVPGAFVRVFENANEFVLCEGTTDAQGEFSCGALEPGLEVTAIAFSAGRFGRAEFAVVDQGGGRMRVEVVLNIAS